MLAASPLAIRSRKSLVDEVAGFVEAGLQGGEAAHRDTASANIARIRAVRAAFPDLDILNRRQHRLHGCRCPQVIPELDDYAVAGWRSRSRPRL